MNRNRSTTDDAITRERDGKAYRRFPAILLFLFIAASLFAGGGREIAPPQIILNLPATSYFSPGLKDGVQDTLTWKVAISASEKMVVKGYRILVTDDSDNEIYRYEESYPAEQPFFDRLFIGMGFNSLKKPLTVPEELTWNGERTDKSAAPEGTYSLRVEGWDDAGGTGKSTAYTVVLDNTPPSAELSFPYTVFSPNTDGNKDILIVEQTGSNEALWEGAFSDTDGNVVHAFRWENSKPVNLTWDGVTTAGETAADGTYQYVLSSTDLAGNSFATSPSTIVIDTKDTPISLSRNVGFFSPNGDGAVDTVSFTFDIPVTDGIKDWTLEILDSDNAVRRTIQGDVAPSTIEFDGKSDSGDVLPEGTYRGKLSVLYENGNNPSATSSEFTLDVTRPVVSIKAFPLVFSPNGDGKKDTVQVYQETSEEESWTGRIYNDEGAVVRTVSWRGRAELTVEWDGRDDANNLLPNGEYSYVLASRDRAGNYAEAKTDPIRLDTRETPVSFSTDGTYFSPNADGSHDTLRFIADISDPSGITKLTVVVTDQSGATVKTFQYSTAETEFVWDGLNDANRPVPDGSYNAEMSIEYDNGNNPIVHTGPVVIDTAVPVATVSSSEAIFSPDGDGNQDEVRIEQTNASDEDTWIGTFTNAEGKVVRTMQWTGTPASFTWDGTDEKGNRLPDGLYRYVLASTDRAGNIGEFTIDRLTIDTRPTPVALRIGSSALSPNGDQVKDTLVIAPVLTITDNIESWNLEIRNSAETTVRAFSGNSTIPAAFEFDGNNDSGDALPEGNYVAHLLVDYRNGNKSSASSPVFVIDTTNPSATVEVETPLFSPNGDGRKDTTTFIQKGTVEDTWRGWIVDSNNRPVRSFSWFGTIDEHLLWDGKDDSGRIVANGRYLYSLSATDKAGNTGESNVVRVSVDNRTTAVSLSFALGYFSPNGDGVRDTLRIVPTVALNEEIESHLLEITDSRGRVVRSFEGTGKVPARITWNGTRSDGSRAADGTYTAHITIQYDKGDRPEAQSAPFVIDSTPPSASITATATLFSPEGDGRKDTILIEQRTSSEDLWEATITDSSSGAVVRNAFWKGAAGNFRWNGKDDEGSVVPDGLFRYELKATDRAGNSTSRVISGIVVDTRAISAFISLDTSAISPNGDGNSDSVSLNLYTSLNEQIDKWSVSMLDASGKRVREIATGRRRSIPATVTWDGRNDSGSVIDGDYTPSLTIEYLKGNLVEAEASRSVLVDVTGPVFDIRMGPTPFSPDDDGENDIERISIASVSDASPITNWRMSILDPYGKTFFERSGTGEPPASIQWNGYSKDDELVQAAEDYRVEVQLTDALGNIGSRTEVLPIDVLVIREGDVLKIRISSIQFAPNSANLLDLEEEKTERNMKTITRLAEILKKYSSYQIRIEGHAVSVYWNDPARAKKEETEELQPLSKARAEAVKAALVDLGIPAQRMTTVGMGGTQPIVPHSDLENRWKSRRVEFILVR